MSDGDKKKAKHGVKINRMTKDQAAAAMAKAEAAGDSTSKFYMQCKKIAK